MAGYRNIWAAGPHGDDTFTALGRLILKTQFLHIEAKKKNLIDDLHEPNGMYSEITKEWEVNHALFQALGLEPDLKKSAFQALSAGSFGIQFQFGLVSNWYSGDDPSLYPLENAIRKETVFKLPEQAAAGWKGVFRQACREREGCENNDTMDRLFGAKLDDDTDSGSDGCLRFFSSFFDRIEPYTINPQDRTTKAGRHPIDYETVPPGSKSRFSLIYVAPDESNDEQLLQDRALLGQLIHKVFTENGFGAKTPEFGRAKMLPASSGGATGAFNRLVTGFSCSGFSSFEELETQLKAIKPGGPR